MLIITSMFVYAIMLAIKKRYKTVFTTLNPLIATRMLSFSRQRFRHSTAPTSRHVAVPSTPRPLSITSALCSVQARCVGALTGTALLNQGLSQRDLSRVSMVLSSLTL